MIQARERQLSAARSFQRMAARYYWLARTTFEDRTIPREVVITWQEEGAKASLYARQLMLIEPLTEN